MHLKNERINRKSGPPSTAIRMQKVLSPRHRMAIVCRVESIIWRGLRGLNDRGQYSPNDPLGPRPEHGARVVKRGAHSSFAMVGRTRTMENGEKGRLNRKMKCVNVEIIAGKSGHPRAVALSFVRDNRLTAGRAPARARPCRAHNEDAAKAARRALRPASSLPIAPTSNGDPPPIRVDDIGGASEVSMTAVNMRQTVRIGSARAPRAALRRCHAGRQPVARPDRRSRGGHCWRRGCGQSFTKVASRPSLLTGPKPAIAHDSVPSTRARYRCLSDNR